MGLAPSEFLPICFAYAGGRTRPCGASSQTCRTSSPRIHLKPCLNSNDPHYRRSQSRNHGFKHMSDRVAFLEGRAVPRLALTGLALIWLSGCSADVSRFNASSNPFSDPFSSQSAQATPAGRRAFGACGRRAARPRGQRGQRPVAGCVHARRLLRPAGRRQGRRMERGRRHADRGRKRRKSQHAVASLRRSRFRAARR